MSDVLVGADRQAIVDQLEESFDLVVERGRPTLITLVGGPGWGKTRLVQELYSRLAAKQPVPRYWPPHIVESESAGVSVLRSRKHVNPMDPHVAVDAALPWLWWGLRCERDSRGVPMRALSNGMSQFLSHSSGMLERVSLRRSARRAGIEAIGGIAGLFLPDVAGFLVGIKPALGEAANRCRTVAIKRRAQRAAKEIEAPETRRVTSEVDSTRVDEVVRHLRDVLGGDLPMVLIIDDAHWADTSTVALLDRILRSPLPVLAIATAWPEDIARQALDEVHVPLGDRRSFGGWLEASEAILNVERIELTRLAPEEIATLVTSAAPRTAVPVVDALVRRADGNPLILRHLLEFPKVRRSLHDGAFGLAPAEVEGLPEEVHALLAERWRELPEPIQEVLAVASMMGAEFLRDLVVEPPEALELIAHSEDPYGWLRCLAGDLREFTERALWDIASESRSRLFTIADIDRIGGVICRAAAQRISRDDFHHLDRRSQRALLQSHVTLAERPEALDACEVRALATSSLLLADLEDDDDDVDDAVLWAESAVRLVDRVSGAEDDEHQLFDLHCRRILGYQLRRCGRLEEAKDVLEGVLLSVEQLERSPKILELQARTLTSLAHVHKAGANPEMAMVVFSSASDVAFELGDALGGWHCRRSIARCLEDLEKFDDAQRLYEDLLDDPAMPDGWRLTLLNDRGDCADGLGQYVIAESRYREVLVHAVEVGDATAAFSAASGLSSALIEQGRVDDAVEILQAAITRAIEHDGPDSEDVTILRNLIVAAALAKGGVFDLSVFGQMSELGPEVPEGHPDRIYFEAVDAYVMAFPDIGPLASDLSSAQAHLVRWRGHHHSDVVVVTALLVQAFLSAEAAEEGLDCAKPVLAAAGHVDSELLILAAATAACAVAAADSGVAIDLVEWLDFVVDWIGKAREAGVGGLTVIALAGAEVGMRRVSGDDEGARAAFERGRAACEQLGRAWEGTVLAEAVAAAHWPEAIDSLRRRAEILEAAGAPRLLVLATMRALGHELFTRDRFAEAESVERLVVDELRVIDGANPSILAGAERNLAVTLAALNRHAEAVALLDDAWELETAIGTDTSGALQTARLRARHRARIADGQHARAALDQLDASLSTLADTGLESAGLGSALEEGRSIAFSAGWYEESRRWAFRRANVARSNGESADLVDALIDISVAWNREKRDDYSGLTLRLAVRHLEALPDGAPERRRWLTNWAVNRTILAEPAEAAGAYLQLAHEHQSSGMGEMSVLDAMLKATDCLRAAARSLPEDAGARRRLARVALAAAELGDRVAPDSSQSRSAWRAAANATHSKSTLAIDVLQRYLRDQSEGQHAVEIGWMQALGSRIFNSGQRELGLTWLRAGLIRSADLPESDARRSAVLNYIAALEVVLRGHTSDGHNDPLFDIVVSSLDGRRHEVGAPGPGVVVNVARSSIEIDLGRGLRLRVDDCTPEREMSVGQVVDCGVIVATAENVALSAEVCGIRADDLLERLGFRRSGEA